MAVQPRLDLGRYIGKMRGQRGDNFLALALQEVQNWSERLLPTTVVTPAAAPAVVTAAASGPAVTPTQPSQSGTALSVNGFALTKGNLNQLNPPAPSGFVTGIWQVDPMTLTVSVSLPVPVLGLIPSIKKITAAYTLVPGDGSILADATAAAFTITLDTANCIAGRRYPVKRINAGVNAVTYTPSSGTVDGAASGSLAAQYASVDLVTDNTNWWIF